VAVVNGIKNAPQIIESMENYDYVEVMACPGGCIGGGGQPIPTTREIREKRIEALYKIDTSKKIRKAHENESVLKIMDWAKKQGRFSKKILHTKYKKRR
jgi:iron only hydrogenase large subunit-like protein